MKNLDNDQNWYLLIILYLYRYPIYHKFNHLEIFHLRLKAFILCQIIFKATHAMPCGF